MIKMVLRVLGLVSLLSLAIYAFTGMTFWVPVVPNSTREFLIVAFHAMPLFAAAATFLEYVEK